VDIGAAFVADGQAAKTVEPGDRALNDPAAHAEPTAVRRPALGQHRYDAPSPEAMAVRLGIVAPVTLQRPGSTSGSASTSADSRERLHHRVEVRDVVHVGGRDLRDERDAARVGDDVVFGALLAAIGWVRSSFFPPRTARTELLSMTVHRWSSRPRCRSSARSVSWSCCQMPARCQRTRRRQHVLPDPQPICFGNICQGIPDRRTKRMPVRIARSESGVRPCRWPRRGRRLGRSESSRAQIASSMRV
jgi:hypothetical protein